MKALDFDWKPLLLVPLLALLALPLVGSGSTWLTLTVAGLAMGMISSSLPPASHWCLV
jgi:branched-chain amino acid transport system permease protein